MIFTGCKEAYTVELVITSVLFILPYSIISVLLSMNYCEVADLK